MKKLFFLAATIVLSNTSSASSCKSLDGIYDLSSMRARCQVSGVSYTPGDDSPLYTILPEHESTYIDGDDGSVGIPGYIEPNSELTVQTSSNCNEVSITVVKKKSFNEIGKTDSLHKMNFKNMKAKKQFFQVRGKERVSGCDYGICGTDKTIQKLKLSSNVDELSLIIENKSSGLLYYFIPYRDKVELKCTFPRV
tara:strand:+ start:137 stop:721 length:585 start_codon:yes stop_codon:yes gene_type:complete